jgi:hypothetical protein
MRPLGRALLSKNARSYRKTASAWSLRGVVGIAEEHRRQPGHEKTATCGINLYIWNIMKTISFMENILKTGKKAGSK